jgi:hypothetical protein
MQTTAASAAPTSEVRASIMLVLLTVADGPAPHKHAVQKEIGDCALLPQSALRFVLYCVLHSTKLGSNRGTKCYEKQMWWWAIGPKLVFNQMEAPVPENMDDSCIGGGTQSVRGNDTKNSDKYVQAGLELVSSYILHRQNMQTLRSSRELGYRQDRDSTW